MIGPNSVFPVTVTWDENTQSLNIDAPPPASRIKETALELLEERLQSVCHDLVGRVVPSPDQFRGFNSPEWREITYIFRNIHDDIHQMTGVSLDFRLVNVSGEPVRGR